MWNAHACKVRARRAPENSLDECSDLRHSVVEDLEPAASKSDMCADGCRMEPASAYRPPSEGADLATSPTTATHTEQKFSALRSVKKYLLFTSRHAFL